MNSLKRGLLRLLFGRPLRKQVRLLNRIETLTVQLRAALTMYPNVNLLRAFYVAYDSTESRKIESDQLFDKAPILLAFTRSQAGRLAIVRILSEIGMMDYRSVMLIKQGNYPEDFQESLREINPRILESRPDIFEPENLPNKLAWSSARVLHGLHNDFFTLLTSDEQLAKTFANNIQPKAVAEGFGRGRLQLSKGRRVSILRAMMAHPFLFLYGNGREVMSEVAEAMRTQDDWELSGAATLGLVDFAGLEGIASAEKLFSSLNL